MARAPSQVRGVILLLGILLIIFAIRLGMNSENISQANFAAAKPIALLDPNTATESELAAIPDLGEKRAGAIVQYREQFRSRHPGQLAFREALDLERISGIGAATVENMEPYLMFGGK